MWDKHWLDSSIILKNLNHETFKDTFNIPTASRQPAEVHIVILYLFTLNHQKKLKRNITTVTKYDQVIRFHISSIEGLKWNEDLFSFLVAAKSCFSLSVVEVKGIVIIEITLQRQGAWIWGVMNNRNSQCPSQFRHVNPHYSSLSSEPGNIHLDWVEIYENIFKLSQEEEAGGHALSARNRI